MDIIQSISNTKTKNNKTIINKMEEEVFDFEVKIRGGKKISLKKARPPKRFVRVIKYEIAETGEIFYIDEKNYIYSYNPVNNRGKRIGRIINDEIIKYKGIPKFEY